MRRLTLVPRYTVLSALTLVIAACGGDKASDKEKLTPAEEFKQQQESKAEAVLRAAPTEKKVAEKLGSKYEIGTAMLRDSITARAKDPKTGCIEKGRKTDPYLVGAVTLWVNMSVVGTDAIRVQESQWTSGAGTLVDECLNATASQWKLTSALAKPGAYVVQVQFR